MLSHLLIRLRDLLNALPYQLWLILFSVLASKAISISTRLKGNSHQQCKFAILKCLTDDFLYCPAEHSWMRASKDFADITDVNRPLCVALGPSLDWFYGYQSIDGQQKWTRRREKGPALKYGHFYKSCLLPSFPPFPLYIIYSCVLQRWSPFL